MAVGAFIFDMDGLLINSEPFWQIAEMEIFAPLGIHLTPELAARTLGMRLDKVVEWYYTQSPWQGPSVEEVTHQIMCRVIELIRERGQAQPGVYELLEFCASTGLPIGLATSSHVELMDAVVDYLGIRHYFNSLHSAENEDYGKPHPAVFLTAAQHLQVDPMHCLVFEDSLRGVIAAKAAQMRCVCVPDHSLRNDPRLAIADKVLDSLTEFDTALWQHFNNNHH